MPARLFAFALLCLLPAAPVPCPAADNGPSLDVMAGQMLMVGFRGLEAGPDSTVGRAVIRQRLGGVVLFDYDVALGRYGRNIDSPAQLLALTSRLSALSQVPLFIAVDQEGGKVQRLKESAGFVETPSAADLGAKGELAAREAGTIIARQLALFRVNLDFAPVLDVNVNPDSPAIGMLGRSFSFKPEQVATLGLAFLDGLHNPGKGPGVLGCVKHFPGHGSALTDSHLGLPDITKTWSRDELIPFARVIQAGAADMVMTAHLYNAHLDPDHPATLSKAVVQGILRSELGYDGVVITDDLGMGAIAERYGMKEAIRLAVEAGCDILLFGNNLTFDPDLAAKAHAVLTGLVRDGTISRERIRLSFDRIMALKARLAERMETAKTEEAEADRDAD